MSILDKLRNAITGGEWHVAYKKSGDNEWKLLVIPGNHWCADPFVIEDNDECFLFVEQYLKEKEKGCIGCFKFVDDKPVSQGVIIENSYHMSYPDVFRYKDRYYMIPESSANNTVDLYTADHFPDKWHKEKTLIEGEKYVDSTVYQDGENYYLISYCMVNGFEVHVFSLDMEKKEIKMLSKKRYDKNTGRPAGRLFQENGKLMRPVQDCSRKYGESLIICQVDDLNNDGRFMEHELRKIRTEDLMLQNRPNRVHHFTRDGEYEVVDVYKEKLDLLHAPRIILRSRRK